MAVENEDTQLVDVCIVGAGFSGLSILHQLLKAGEFDIACVEKGSGIGGTWFWSRYPGARVDTSFPAYQFADEELWEEFNWKERFPGYDGIQEYFAFVDKKWQLSKHIRFNTTVTSATFDEQTNKWDIICETSDGRFKHISARWFIAAVGFAAKPFTPDFPGLDKFMANPKKQCAHTNDWPRDQVDFHDKRVAVIGTGSSGLQVIQEIGPVVKHLTVFQRTPCETFPMRQRALTINDQDEMRVSGAYGSAFAVRLANYYGLPLLPKLRDTFDASPAERRAYYEKLWQVGGFAFWMSGYQDLVTSKEANDEAYRFLAEKNRERVRDERKRELLVPMKAPYAIGTKRPCLEQAYFEVYNQDNVDLEDVSETPIKEVTEDGVVTHDGRLVEVDVVVLATGFDSVTGSLTQMNIQGVDGRTLSEKWAPGAASCLGISMHDYPNMFFTYGLHAPTAFSNGPTCIEIQANWIVQALLSCRDAGVVRFEATCEGEEAWKKNVQHSWDVSLLPGTKSWYQGSNIPGKRVEPLCYAGGIPSYAAALEQSRVEGYTDFIQSKDGPVKGHVSDL